MARHFFVLLWGDLVMNLLLRIVKPPTEEEIAERSAEAASALLKLHRAPLEHRKG